MVKYKSSKYKGYTINFHDQGRGLVLAKAPRLTKQYIGSGKNKGTALRSAKKAIDRLKKK